MIEPFKRRQELMHEICELQKALEISNAMVENYKQLHECEAKEAEKWKEACHYWYNKAQEK